MKKYSKILFYILVNGVILILIIWLAQYGKKLETPETVIGALQDATNNQTNDSLVYAIKENLHHPLSILIAQLIIIIIVSRIFGKLFQKIGQPLVIGEIVAGILLGPSLLGTIYPTAFNVLFPTQSLGNIQFLSQIGLILFMFVIGMDLDLSLIRKKATDAIIISHASIIIPFTLGMGLAYFLYSRFAGEGVPFHSFGLFIGISMSITAFPVLARIVQERGWTKTHLGTMAITCAAIDDITAWCLLAIVIAITKAGSLMGAFFTIGLAIIYVLSMILLVKPFLEKVSNIFPNRETMSKSVIALFFIILFLSAYITEIIGIHALFGAFMAGVAMPGKAGFKKVLIEKIEDISMVVLLPLFFVYTGLRTQIGLLNEWSLWITCCWIILTAIVGKFAGSIIASKFVKQNWHDSLSLGILMNTRGLMELVVLNIGLDLGVLSPQIFSMLVLMALLTTFMTGPALKMVDSIFNLRLSAETKASLPEEHARIMVSFGPSSTGVKLLRIAAKLDIHPHQKTTISAFHLTKGTDAHPSQTEVFSKESFLPLLKESNKLKVDIQQEYKVTDDIEKEIIKKIKEQNIDFLLIGAGKSLTKGTFLGFLIHTINAISKAEFGKIVNKQNNQTIKSFVHERALKITEAVPCNVGILIDQGFEKISKLIVFITGPSDYFLLGITKKFLVDKTIHAIIDVAKMPGEPFALLNSEIENIKFHHPNSVMTVDDNQKFYPFDKKSTIALVSYHGYQSILSKKRFPVHELTTIIIRPKEEVFIL